jgi:ERF superfamily
MSKADRPVTLAESDALRALPANRLDPQALISKAIEQGAGIETLERLVQLAKDLRAITAAEAFYAARAEFKKRCPPIKKTKTADIETRSGASYSYKYSPLDAVTEVVDPHLAAVGLSYSWEHPKATQPHHIASDCILAHVLGHKESSKPVEVPYSTDGRMNSAQSVGSALTYSKRYSLLGILGKAAEDEDDDAHSAHPPSRGRDNRPPPAAPSHHPPRRDDDPSAGGAEPRDRGHDAPESDRPRDPAAESAAAEASLFTDTVGNENDDVEREALLVDVRHLRDTIRATRTTKKAQEEWAKEQTEAWDTYVGKGVTPSQANPASLYDLKKWLETRVIGHKP